MYKRGILVAVQVNTVVITSSPFFKPANRYAKCKESVPEPVAKAEFFFEKIK